MNKFLIISISILCGFQLHAQPGADDVNGIDIDKYRRIFFENDIMYLDTETGEMISSQIYDSLVIEASEYDIICYNGLNHWDSTQFHVYKKQPKYPFLIKFAHLNFSPPVAGKQVVTSRFGKRRRGPHRGIDIDLVTGDDVMSVLDGVVRFVNYSSGHGRTVVIRHDNGIETVYAHLSKYNVKVNERVYQGQVIGKGGISGNARGSHLHFEVRYNGVAIHPEYIFDFTDFTISDHSIYVTKKWTNPLFHYSTRQSEIECVCSIEDIEKELVKPRPELQEVLVLATTHEVRKGDTLYSIARQYNCSINHLIKVNGISNPSRLKIGQSIKIN